MSSIRFGADALFLKKHTDLVVLRSGDSAIAVVPAYQGRVMTSTAYGDDGISPGWLNYPLIAKGVAAKSSDKHALSAHILAFGGEERFWLGPEGGQYALFFKKGSAFTFENWYAPAPIDSIAWDIVAAQERMIVFEKAFSVVNYAGFHFEMKVRRTITLLDEKALACFLGKPLPSGVKAVAYRTQNTLINNGAAAWIPATGLPSVWLLGMFRPSRETVLFIPCRISRGACAPVAANDYFGGIAPDRIAHVDGVVYLKGDGCQRGKLGVSPQDACGLVGSYAPASGYLTLLHFEQTTAPNGYVNARWEHQAAPYAGDAINVYNDGPLTEGGAQMGPFYELESSSPALALAPGESSTHTQTTLHCYGSPHAIQSAVAIFSLPDLTKVGAVLK